MLPLHSYSICAGVDDGELRVGVRHVDGGAFSTWVHRQLKAGDEVQVFPPQGRFHVPIDPASARHYVGIAAGSGITPILSIMKTVLAREPMSRFTLIYGNRRPASAMFKEELEDLKNRYMTRLTLHHVFSREHVDAPLMAGRLDQAKLGEFLAGPVPAGGLYMYEQNRMLFNPVDRPLMQPYAAFSGGQLITIAIENLLGRYLGKPLLAAMSQRARTQAQLAAEEQVRRDIARLSTIASASAKKNTKGK